ncbi:hypothetical protein [Spiroplasma endosymbiont of Labia minor]|uniref:hypothetical protein n=1 Tax=Spiroplasma endosymbiont of Labia minor TaxID=3066305 RepID=UPI0030CEDED6
MSEKVYDPKCFKCVEEMNKSNLSKGVGGNILLQKMQQGLTSMDPDSIYVCARHSK